MVLTIVGMVGFVSILAAVSETPSPPEPMYAAANISELNISMNVSSTSEEENTSSPTEPKTLLIMVLDSENQGVTKANVILRSPDRKMAYSGLTDAEGKVRIELPGLALPPGKVEGYLTVKAMKQGHRDFTDEYFVKIIEE